MWTMPTASLCRRRFRGYQRPVKEQHRQPPTIFVWFVSSLTADYTKKTLEWSRVFDDLQLFAASTTVPSIAMHSNPDAVPRQPYPRLPCPGVDVVGANLHPKSHLNAIHSCQAEHMQSGVFGMHDRAAFSALSKSQRYTNTEAVLMIVYIYMHINVGRWLVIGPSIMLTFWKIILDTLTPCLF